MSTPDLAEKTHSLSTIQLNICILTPNFHKVLECISLEGSILTACTV